MNACGQLASKPISLCTRIHFRFFYFLSRSTVHAQLRLYRYRYSHTHTPTYGSCFVQFCSWHARSLIAAAPAASGGYLRGRANQGYFVQWRGHRQSFSGWRWEQ